jgi:hypothetical protein
MSDNQLVYEIRVQGHLNESWSGWFDGWTIGHDPDGTTKLSGPVADQAALHGQLVKIRNLSLLLVSLELQK